MERSSLLPKCMLWLFSLPRGFACHAVDVECAFDIIIATSGTMFHWEHCSGPTDQTARTAGPGLSMCVCCVQRRRFGPTLCRFGTDCRNDVPLGTLFWADLPKRYGLQDHGLCAFWRLCLSMGNQALSVSRSPWHL